MDEHEFSLKRHIAWLENAPPDDWHRVVLDFNWDDPIDPLLWIARHPDCDKATALTMFWNAQPAYYLIVCAEKGEDDLDAPEWALVKQIAARIHAQGYKRAKIAFDADDMIQQDYDELVAMQARIAQPPMTAHPDMKRSLRGRRVENDPAFYQRYPEAFHGTLLIELPEPSALGKAWSAVKRLWG